MMTKRRQYLSMAIIFWAISLLWVPGALAADSYPGRPVKILIPFGPGSTTDVATRILSDSLAKDLKGSIVVDYKAGGSGMVGAAAVAQSKPDGYTLLCGTIATHVIGPILSPDKPPYDPVQDFAPIALIGESPNVLFVNSQSPFKTFEDVIDYAKKNPGKLNCGTPGVGTAAHFVLELINMNLGTKIVHVPYKEGTGAVAVAVLGGHIDMGAMAASAAMPQVKAGKLRLLIGTSKFSDAPDAPTFQEKKLPQASIGIWLGYFAPAKTPKAIQDKLAAAFAKAIKYPDNVKKLTMMGFIAEYKPPQEFSELIKSQLEIIAKAGKAAGIIK
jgi:tripartite-type tricarboxylate transporter receptor subunit TctC